MRVPLVVSMICVGAACGSGSSANRPPDAGTPDAGSPDAAVAVFGALTPPIISTIDLPPVAIAIPDAPDISYGLIGPRQVAVADLDGDGRRDLLVAPTLFTTPPMLPVQVWINRGDGTF